MVKALPVDLETTVVALGGPISEVLDDGRTPVFRTEKGVVRVGTPKRIQAESAGQRHARERFPALADRMPKHLGTSELVSGEGTLHLMLETDLGPVAADTAAACADWVSAFSSTRAPGADFDGQLHVALSRVSPPGQPNLTRLIRGLQTLRRDGTALPFPAKQAELSRALSAEVSVRFERCCAHGALYREHVLEGGVCHWRFFGDDRLWGEDVAAFLDLSDCAVVEALHVLKWAWTHDPLRAAHALNRLGVMDGPRPERTVLELVGAHPGLSPGDLEAILGCPLGSVSGARAARALGRVKGLSVGGKDIELRADPPVRARADARFRQPRGRSDSRLFARAGQGVQLEHAGADAGARASLTPEHFASHQARVLGGGVVVDGFCGAGGNTIAFARRPDCRMVVAVDNDADRLQMAKENARVYGVSGKIRFVHGDFFDAAESWVLRELGVTDAVCFVDPPWAEGDAFIARAWRTAEARYRVGAIKLPRSFAIDEDRILDVALTEEGFPSFVTVYWR